MMTTTANEFNGTNYSIISENNQFTLVHPVSENETFDSFDELVESHPICEEAREFFFGSVDTSDRKYYVRVMDAFGITHHIDVTASAAETAAAAAIESDSRLTFLGPFSCQVFENVGTHNILSLGQPKEVKVG